MKISFEDINNYNSTSKMNEIIEYGNAVLTHYIHNNNSSVAKLYKNSAKEYIKHALEYKFPEKVISSRVAEEALQYTLFDYAKEIPFLALSRPKFEFVDLFAGIGGFRLALQKIGGKCIYTSEWNKDSQITYRDNFGEIPFGDITKEETKAFIPKKIDILCAGFPCQAFSIAGHRKGFADTRGTLFFDVEKIINKHRPKVVFLENVKNLLSHDKGNTFETIVRVLEDKLKYKVKSEVLNTATHANIPQNRERIFIVAFDPKQVKNYKDFCFPKKIKLTKTIHDILDKEKQEDLFYYKEDHRYYQELKKTMVSKDTVYQWRRVYVRENKSNLCPTLTANMGTGGHNVPLIKDDFGIRKLTPKECFAFQGYPMNKYVLPKGMANSKLYMQAGNSVTTTLIERIAKQIIKVL